MLQQWRLEAHRFMEGNGKWDIWLHDWESMRQNVQAWFWRASLHVRAVPRKHHQVLKRDGSECVSCCCEGVSHAESFYLGWEELLKPCSGLWNPAWNSPRALTWKCSLPVTPVAAHRVSGHHLKLWSFPLRNSGLGEGIAKWFLSYISQNLLHYLLWHIVSSHRVLLNRFQEEATP